ncbi:MAG: hypothetical protein H6737_16310 [Alphaproteobacteria bacterium]|nr:hypothetical protein [Alphaproteobacteria bacterium]
MLAPLLLSRTLAATPVTLGVHLADHSVAPPFGNVGPTRPIRPALTLEGELHWLEGRYLALRPVARLTGSLHGHAGNGLRLTAGLTGRATSPFGLFGETGLELGASHTFWGPSLAFEDGGYTPSNDPGRLGVAGGFELGAGLDLERLDAPPLAVVVTYRWFVHSGWMPVLPVAPKSELGIGVRYTPGKREPT